MHVVVERCRNPSSRRVLVEQGVLKRDIIHEKLETAWLMKAWRKHATTLTPTPKVIFDLRLPSHDVGDTGEPVSKMVWEWNEWNGERSFLLDRVQIDRAVAVITTGLKMRHPGEMEFELAYNGDGSPWKRLQKQLSGFGVTKMTKLVREDEVERKRPEPVYSETSESGMRTVWAGPQKMVMLELSEALARGLISKDDPIMAVVGPVP